MFREGDIVIWKHPSGDPTGGTVIEDEHVFNGVSSVLMAESPSVTGGPSNVVLIPTALLQLVKAAPVGPTPFDPKPVAPSTVPPPLIPFNHSIGGNAPAADSPLYGSTEWMKIFVDPVFAADQAYREAIKSGVSPGSPQAVTLLEAQAKVTNEEVVARQELRALNAQVEQVYVNNKDRESLKLPYLPDPVVPTLLVPLVSLYKANHK